MRFIVFALGLSLAAHVAAQDDAYARAASQDPSVRCLAAMALASDPSPRAHEMLLILLERDVDPTVRATAARAIERSRDADLAPALQAAAVQDPAPQVRAAAQQSYQRLWPRKKRPAAAAGFSLLCPGCGHLYLRRPLVAAAYLGSTVALIGGGIAVAGGEGAGLEGPAESARAPVAVQLLAAGQNVWFYSIFDAYRDARLMRFDEGYRYPIARASLGDLASAPFRPKVLQSPWVWVGVPLAVGGAIGLSYLLGKSGGTDPTLFDVDRLNVLGRDFSPLAAFGLGEAYWGALFLPVGVGEEALFRGFLQSSLSEAFGKWGGLAGASVVFGAVHILNFVGTDQTVGETALYVSYLTAVGTLFGLAHLDTGFRLETNVAMHFWYDFLIGTIAFLADPEHQPFVVRTAIVF